MITFVSPRNQMQPIGKSIKWYKVNRHVDSLQKRIYRASKNNDTLILLDKCILEPIVSKGTR